MKDIYNARFARLKSGKTRTVCLPCTDGTWIQLDFFSDGPQILNFEVQEGKPTYNIHHVERPDSIEDNVDAFRKLFTPFFSQPAKESGMNEEIFYLMETMFEMWNHYEEMTSRFLYLANIDTEEEEEIEPLLCNTVSNPMKTQANKKDKHCS